MPIFGFLFLGVVFILVILMFVNLISKVGIKGLIESGSKSVENEILLNELLKRKLEKDEELSAEELAMIKELRANKKK